MPAVHEERPQRVQGYLPVEASVFGDYRQASRLSSGTVHWGVARRRRLTFGDNAVIDRLLKSAPSGGR
ncbi:hypothetical protein GCM10023318_02740 [Nocardia callitridis]|uniref:Transposase n=1 Tax=Nocardia callitridis TaxID=648753 RepID=A0ABP9JRG7_9NOCA